jgi:hypothetical protein
MLSASNHFVNDGKKFKWDRLVFIFRAFVGRRKIRLAEMILQMGIEDLVPKKKA